MRQKKMAVCFWMGVLLAAGCGNWNADLDVSMGDGINPEDRIGFVGASEREGNRTQAQADNIQAQSDQVQSDQLQSDRLREDSGQSREDSRQSQEGSGQSREGSGQSQEDSGRTQEDSMQTQTGNAQGQADSELDGKIESIGENSVVINKTFLISEDTAVSYVGSSEKVLVDVYFSEETEFEVWTVKNGGVNGDADVEKRQGAFSDLKQGGNINMTGYYDGNDFHARYVILYHFV